MTPGTGNGGPWREREICDYCIIQCELRVLQSTHCSLLQAGDKRQCLRKHRKIAQILAPGRYLGCFLLYFVFKERDIITWRWTYKMFFPRYLRQSKSSQSKRSKTKHWKDWHFFFLSSLSFLLLSSLSSFIPPSFPFPPYHWCRLWTFIVLEAPSIRNIEPAFCLLHCLSLSLWSPNHWVFLKAKSSYNHAQRLVFLPKDPLYIKNSVIVLYNLLQHLCH